MKPLIITMLACLLIAGCGKKSKPVYRSPVTGEEVKRNAYPPIPNVPGKQVATPEL